MNEPIPCSKCACQTCRRHEFEEQLTVCIYSPRPGKIEFEFDRVLSRDWVGPLPRPGDRIVTKYAVTFHGAGTEYDVKQVRWTFPKENHHGRSVDLFCMIALDPEKDLGDEGCPKCGSRDYSIEALGPKRYRLTCRRCVCVWQKTLEETP